MFVGITPIETSIALTEMHVKSLISSVIIGDGIPKWMRDAESLLQKSRLISDECDQENSRYEVKHVKIAGMLKISNS